MRKVDPILGEVKSCPRCGDFWPIDPEFFIFNRAGKPLSYCRACWYERNVQRNAARREAAA